MNVVDVAHAGDAINQWIAAIVPVIAPLTTVHQNALEVSFGTGLGNILFVLDDINYRFEVDDWSGLDVINNLEVRFINKNYFRFI